VFTYIKHKISKRHTLGIVANILEEIRNDILNDKIINVPNLGKLYLKKKNPRKFFNVIQNKVTDLPARKLLFFEVDPELTRQITKYLDVDRTFGSG
jgi:nucleoid DNA-binding protein